MENTEFNTLVNQLAQSVNDEVYTNLLDQGVDPAIAYESTFNSGWSFAESAEQFPGKTEDEQDAEIANWVPTV